MINPTYPGVYVREESSGARAIAGVATSITVFIGMTQRGPLLSPKRLVSLRDYERIFGPSKSAGGMTEQVRLFFENGGGEAWVTRIAQGAEEATITLRDEDGNDTLQLKALEAGIDGNNLRAEIDYNTASPESTFNLTVYRRAVQDDGSVMRESEEIHENLSMRPGASGFVETIVNGSSSLVSAASLDATPGHAESILYSGLLLPSNDGDAGSTITERLPDTSVALNIRVNGGPAIPVTVVDPGGDADDFAAALQTALDDRLSSEGVTISCTSAAPPPTTGMRLIRIEMDASFAISEGSTNDLVGPLMLSVGHGAVYVDQYAMNRPAPSGYAARIHGSPANNNIAKLLNFAGAAKSDLTDWALIDASPDASHTFAGLAYADPTGTMMIGTRDTPAPPDLSLGALSNVVENLNTIAQSIASNSNGRWKAKVHGHRLVLLPTFGTSDADITAALSTHDGGGAGSGYDIADTAQPFASGANPNPQNIRNVKAYTLGQRGGIGGAGHYQDGPGATAGDDGLIPGEPEYRAAFDVIERQVDLFNLMVLPRAVDKTGVQTDAARKMAFNAASAFCAKQRAFLIVDPPSDSGPGNWIDAPSAATGVDTLRVGLESRNSAVFWPRLRKGDGTLHDPGGAVAGLMARIDGSRGIWKAPAGVEATIRGVVGLQYPLSDPDNGEINPKAVNALRVFPGGVISWGARTLIGYNSSGNIDDKYIPVRRTMLYIEESLYRGLRFAVFEPNAEPLWAQIRLAAGSFMNGLFRQGAFAGQKASDAYYVLCDANTTTETDRQLGIVNVVVAFAPLRPAEFVILTVKQIAGQVEV